MVNLKGPATSRAVILVKAAPVIGAKHGETVCCAGIDLERRWVRLYPVSFRVLDDVQRFKRWDIVTYKGRASADDQRPESCRVDSQSLSIVGHVPGPERSRLLDSIIVPGLAQVALAGRSLALLKPEIKRFRIEPRSPMEVAAEQRKIDLFHAQEDLFIPRPLVPREACPYSFCYDYETEDGERSGTCQDWETEATFFKWRYEYGEAQALRHMQTKFGDELPARGLYFAMGTHSRYPDTWLINGLIQHKPSDQIELF